MKKILYKTDQNNPLVKQYIKDVEEGSRILKFLKESNAIENVYDAESLKQAAEAWRYLLDWDILTVKNILQTHAILMKGKLNRNNLGKFRKEPVWIGGHEAKPWWVVSELMEAWVDDAKFSLNLQKPTIKENFIKSLHIRFEAIHPFIDGNGRIGRILLNWQRVKVGLPILIIYEKEKDRYYRWFQ